MLADLEAGWSEDPVRLALVHTYRRYDIPVEHLVDFLAAMTSDLDVDRLPDLAALDRYMGLGVGHRPAGAAGLGTAPGVAREEAARTRSRSARRSS